MLNSAIKWGGTFFIFLGLTIAGYLTAGPDVFPLGFILMVIPGFFCVIILYSYVRPYNREEVVFKSVVNAVDMMAKSTEPIVYDEAYQCLQKAYQTLKKIRLDELEWYGKTNQILKRFVENFELIVLPAAANANMKTEHLEAIALAVYSRNSSKIEEINGVLENEPSYKKEQKKPPKQPRNLSKMLMQNRVGRVIVSLCFGYGLVLVVCLFYVLGTQQEFLVFARERPDIIIIGGLVASGITFWRTKSES